MTWAMVAVGYIEQGEAYGEEKRRRSCVNIPAFGEEVCVEDMIFDA